MNQVNRRNFLRLAGAGAAAAAAAPLANAIGPVSGSVIPQQTKPATNIDDALKVPRNERSMPDSFRAGWLWSKTAGQ